MKSELRKQQYTVFFDCNHLASSLANTKIMLLYRYWFVFFVFEGNFQVQAPGNYIRRGDLTEGFCVTS